MRLSMMDLRYLGVLPMVLSPKTTPIAHRIIMNKNNVEEIFQKLASASNLRIVGACKAPSFPACVNAIMDCSGEPGWDSVRVSDFLGSSFIIARAGAFKVHNDNLSESPGVK